MFGPKRNGGRSVVSVREGSGCNFEGETPLKIITYKIEKESTEVSNLRETSLWMKVWMKFHVVFNGRLY